MYKRFRWHAECWSWIRVEPIVLWIVVVFCTSNEWIKKMQAWIRETDLFLIFCILAALGHIEHANVSYFVVFAARIRRMNNFIKINVSPHHNFLFSCLVAWMRSCKVFDDTHIMMSRWYTTAIGYDCVLRDDDDDDDGNFTDEIDVLNHLLFMII